MLNIFWLKLRILFRNPMVLFIYGILSKWYIAIVLTSIVVVYWVFKGLISTGILQASEKIVWTALSDAKSIAQHCTPKIARPSEAWECIGNPPKYKASKEEVELEKGLKAIADPATYGIEHKDPYEEK